MADSEVIQEHYRRLGPNYNALLEYSPDFVRTLTSRMIDKLALDEHDRMVDLGCGTGMYSVDILQQVDLQHPILGVDPFEEMLAHIPDGARIVPIQADAVEFSRRPGIYDKILIKEAVHHLEPLDELFSNLHDRLAPGGVMLLVHVPPRVEYPLFEAALERCLTWHADPDHLVEGLKTAGFDVQRDGVDYEHRLPKDRYFDMVRHRYMSVLTSFSDEELAEGLDEMKRTYADETDLVFNDHFDEIVAVRPLDAPPTAAAT